MPSISKSLDIYWDLDALLDEVINGVRLYTDLGEAIQSAFKKGKSKHMKYINEMAKHSMLYAAHILDPRHRMSSIKALMANKIDEIHAAASSFLIKEWPELGVNIATASTLLSSINIRPPRLFIAQWKAL